MHDPHGLALNRRDLLKSIGTLSVAGSTAGMFVPIAGAAEAAKEWTGYSICDHCNHVPSCGIKFHARGNVIESIENWKENPRHILCSKGLATLQRLYNPNRLLHPMKRTNPKGSEDPGFVRCSWDEAYRMIAENLLRIRKRYGADSVMFYAGDPKEPRPPIIRLARHFGSVHWANESSAACRAGCMQAEQLTWGRPSTGTMPTEKTRSFMIMATNVWAQPLGWWESLVKAKARGCKIITVDTRRTKAAELADIHLAPRVGTDSALAMGMIRVLIKEGLYNREFVEKWCHGFEELAAYCETFTPEKTEEITGVPAADIVAAARMVCIGCGACAVACPYEAPKLDRKAGKMRKCDMCVDRLARKELPVCVAACPQRALDFGTVEELRKRHGDDGMIAPLAAGDYTKPNLLITKCAQAQPAPERTRSWPDFLNDKTA